MSLEDLSPQLLEKAKACKSIDELKALCESLGMKLTDEEMEGIAGGFDCKIDCFLDTNGSCTDVKK